MPDYKTDCAALILAAGFSKRMGTFKPLLPVGDDCAAALLINSFKSAGIGKVGVVTGNLREKLSPVIERCGAFEIYNEAYASGMFSSVHKGIECFAEHGTELAGLMLCLGDCPLISRKTITLLLKAAADNPGKLAVACYGGKKGHPLWIPRVFFAEILAYGGEGGLREVTARYESAIVRVETGEESVLMDMDTPEDYAKLLAYHKNAVGIEYLDGLIEKRRLFLVRHGQIKQHREKIFLGQYDAELSKDSEAVLAETADYLKARSVEADVIYTSDLTRAYDSAVILAQRLGIKRVEAVKGFREIALGAWDGRYISDIMREFPERYEERGKNLISFKIDENSENFFELQYRVLSALARILKSDLKRDIIIVSHSGAIRSILARARGLEMSGAMNLKGPDKGRVLEIV